MAGYCWGWGNTEHSTAGLIHHRRYGSPCSKTTATVVAGDGCVQGAPAPGQADEPPPVQCGFSRPADSRNAGSRFWIRLSRRPYFATAALAMGAAVAALVAATSMSSSPRRTDPRAAEGGSRGV